MFLVFSSERQAYYPCLELQDFADGLLVTTRFTHGTLEDGRLLAVTRLMADLFDRCLRPGS